MKNVTEKSPCLKLKFHAQRETVTQIIIRTPNGGRPNVVKHKEKQAVTAVVNNREYRHRYQKATKKEKPALLGEFTKLTGYHRKSAVRLLSSKPVREVMVSDNGSEFINYATEIWCAEESLAFTRSRDHKKNDNCFVEQKNGAVVREYVGYDRLSGFDEQALLAAVYAPQVPLLNAPFTIRWNFSRVSTRLSCACINGLHSQTAFRHRSGFSFR
jgi:hypothetical protein